MRRCHASTILAVLLCAKAFVANAQESHPRGPSYRTYVDNSANNPVVIEDDVVLESHQGGLNPGLGSEQRTNFVEDFSSEGTSQTTTLVGRCPAGMGGPQCGSAMSWKYFESCAIPAGDDAAAPEQLTVEEAKVKCEGLETCKGFTFEGSVPEGPLSGARIWVHFKAKFDCFEAEWIAWRKITKTGSSPAPPPGQGFANPSDALSERKDDSKGGNGVAMCLTGQMRQLSTTHQALHQNVLEVLQPDVFIYTPQEGDGELDLYTLQDYVAEIKIEDEDIRSALYAETANPQRVIELEYLGVQGNWFGNQCLRPALSDSRPGSAICMYYNQHRCLEMIKHKEHERGVPYAHVVVSRTDFRWLAPHPPLELLQADAVWIPSGSDWEGGINDRHAVMRRRDADVYLGGWKLITKGTAKEVMLDTLGSMKVNGYPGPNTENYLKARLQHHGIPIERFPSVSYLTCTQRVKSRWTQCSGTSSNDAPGWLYKEEMEHASRIARCVRSAWTAKKMEECREDITHLYRGIR